MTPILAPAPAADVPQGPEPSRRLRVLALTNLYPNPFQPHRAAFNRQQLRALGARHAMAVIAPIAWTDEWAARRRGAAPLPAGRRRVAEDGLQVFHPRYLFPPKVLRSTYGPCFLRSVRGTFERAAEEFRPDLVYASWAYPDGWAAVRLGLRAGLPVVIKVHGSDLLAAGDHAGRLRGTAEAMSGADGIVAVSRDLAGRAVALGAAPSRVRVVYSGVDTDIFQAGPKAEARAALGVPAGVPVMVYVGNLVPVKGPDVLVEACSKLKSQGTRFACYLAGDGPLRGRLEQRVAEAGLGGAVRFLGAVAHRQLPAWFRAADLTVLPSRSEGVPNVLLESIACGTPFVASRVGGVPEVADWGPGRLVEPGNAAALAEALADCLSGRTDGAGAATPAVDRGARGLPRSHAAAAAEIAALFEQVLAAHNRKAPA